MRNPSFLLPRFLFQNQRVCHVLRIGILGLCIAYLIFGTWMAGPGFFSTSTGVAGIAIGMLLFWTARAWFKIRTPEFMQVNAKAKTARLHQAEIVAGLGSYEIVLDAKTKTSDSYWSDGLYKILGVDRSDGPLLGEDYLNRLVETDDRHLVRCAFGKLACESGNVELEYRVVRPDGQPIHLCDCAQSIPHPHGGITISGSRHDVTSLRMGERKLQAAAAHIQVLTEQLQEAHQCQQKMIVSLDILREEDQRRQAKEMHDDFGQLLAAMKMDLAVLSAQLPSRDYKLARLVVSINSLVDTMIVSVRRIIADLPPKSVDENGLFKALELLTARYSQRHPVVCRLTLPQPEPIIDENIATPIYRIVQEALNNVVKHAHATRVDIHITCHDSDLLLCVADNGCGITPKEMHKTNSFGLVGMRERVAALGGEMLVDSNAGTGTAIRVIVPATICAAKEPRG
jgi:signal transduction histidine kinase